jgi:hypothetical protein
VFSWHGEFLLSPVIVFHIFFSLFKSKSPSFCQVTASVRKVFGPLGYGSVIICSDLDPDVPFNEEKN